MLRRAFQKRWLFIQTDKTPNANALKFRPVDANPIRLLPSSHSALEFRRPLPSASPSLVRKLFLIPTVSTVMIGSDFITVVKNASSPNASMDEEEDAWRLIKPEIYAALMESIRPSDVLVSEETISKLTESESNEKRGNGRSEADEEESEVVLMIKEVLDSRIRPAVQEDGGDVELVSFNEESGVVKLRMQGSCRGCASSAVTLKHGIENMLRHYIPEVKTVEQVEDEVQDEAFQQLEEKLRQEQK